MKIKSPGRFSRVLRVFVVVFGVKVEVVQARSILTRSSGYLSGVSSHSVNPYRGCSLGRSLCGVACYVRHNQFVCKGRIWGDFLEVKANAAQLYSKSYQRERDWARQRGDFSLFLASSTDPFLPQERTYGVTRALLQAMAIHPPDTLIVQTHSPQVVDCLAELQALAILCRVRVHLSIEGDRDHLPGLPRSAFSVESRFAAARQLRECGLWTVATLSPLHPIAQPQVFFERLAQVVDALVLDHFVGGDGSSNGSRTRRTDLPAAMESVQPGSSSLEYRSQVLQWASQFFPGPIGVGADGFAGRYLGR